MTQIQSSGHSFLDEVRKNEGNDRCIRIFTDICEKDKKRAVSLINDRRLTFPCLFILTPQIGHYHLDRFLSPDKATALRIINSFTGPQDSAHMDDLSERNSAVYRALKWIWGTGYADDVHNDDYEELLEVTASVLIGLYQDIKVLPDLVDLIFKRSRSGRNIHNLVWAAFQSRSPEVLKMVAQHIRSSDSQDAGLACSLLGIEAPEAGGTDDPEKRYDAYVHWLGDNDPFLYFTGESLQLASQPAFYRIDLERKYIHRGTPSYERQPVIPADSREREAVAAFHTLGDEDQRLLSEYSHRLHQENRSEWKIWVQHPIDEQVKAAKRNQGVLNDYGIRLFV